jgi:hypothetical protein
MVTVLATGVSVAATVSDEELNAALDARLKASGVQLNTVGMTIREQVEAKKQWYDSIYSNVSTVTLTDDGPKVSQEELNAAYDLRLKASGVVLNTEGLSLSEQLATKKKWYEEFHLNQSFDASLNLLGIEVETDGMSTEEQLEVKREVLENWYENI